MLLFLSKFLPMFIYPIGLITIILVLAILFRKKTKFQIYLLGFGLAIILISSNRLFSFSMARSLEGRYTPVQNIHPVGAIILLGGGTESNQSPRSFVEVNGAGDRVIQAAKLYKDGYAPLIIATGGNIVWTNGRATTPAEEMETLLVFMGVPESAIILEDKSQNTYENAVECLKIIRELKITDAILVTSAIHMPRAVQSFRSEDVEIIPYPVDFVVTDLGWNELLHGSVESKIINLLPNEGSIRLTTNLIYEYVGMAVYALRQRIGY
jgi:uncharacterized SAM-binding protein YcdF (DUF218 family)